MNDLQALFPNGFQLLAILLMAGTTYFTRIAGYLILRKGKISARINAVLEAAPCCVMISIVAPFFMTDDPITLISLLLTIVYSIRFNFALTVMFSVLTQCLLLHFF